MKVDLRGQPATGDEHRDFPFQTTTSKTPVNNSSFHQQRSPRNDPSSKIQNMLSIKNVMRQSMASQQPKPRVLNNGFKIYSVPKSTLAQQPQASGYNRSHDIQRTAPTHGQHLAFIESFKKRAQNLEPCTTFTSTKHRQHIRPRTRLSQDKSPRSRKCAVRWSVDNETVQ